MERNDVDVVLTSARLMSHSGMGDHAKTIILTEAAGKATAVTPGGIGDIKNDIMLYSILEAENHDIAAKAFANHPHLTIPESSIEVMEVRAMGPHQESIDGTARSLSLATRHSQRPARAMTA